MNICDSCGTPYQSVAPTWQHDCMDVLKLLDTLIANAVYLSSPIIGMASRPAREEQARRARLLRVARAQLAPTPTKRGPDV